jgi:flagellar basal body-associated protein FliL
MSSDAKPAAPEAAAGEKKPSAVLGIVRVVVSAVLVAGAAYGGVRMGLKNQHGAAAADSAAPSAHGSTVHHQYVERPPGPTLPLEPFLLTILDANGKTHPMKMTIAVEFDPHTKDDPKVFANRIRDTVITYLRSMSHEQVKDPNYIEKMRADLLERCRVVGAFTAERILVTDFVVQ